MEEESYLWILDGKHQHVAEEQVSSALAVAQEQATGAQTVIQDPIADSVKQIHEAVAGMAQMQPNEKFFPDSYQIEKQREFMSLKQHDISKDDYEAQLTALSRFTPAIIAKRDEVRGRLKFSNTEVDFCSSYTTLAEP
ncbi:hypothetical protein Acr_15g0004630 [Actinidia rufa]|uniref:Uncharacterized protein n=1 Tax=Actinidia rufa TaxID=165716 RepID=A0A7J0FTG1_9ERIC|nr:hypothetical protein Acr_15g0004630 [Actinidia rufa]